MVHSKPYSVRRAGPGAAAARRTWQAPTHTASQNCAAGLGMAREGDQTPRMPRRLSTSVRYQSANCGAAPALRGPARTALCCVALRTLLAPEDRQGGLDACPEALTQSSARHHRLGESGGVPQARLGHMGQRPAEGHVQVPGWRPRMAHKCQPAQRPQQDAVHLAAHLHASSGSENSGFTPNTCRPAPAATSGCRALHRPPAGNAGDDFAAVCTALEARAWGQGHVQAHRPCREPCTSLTAKVHEFQGTSGQHDGPSDVERTFVQENIQQSNLTLQKNQSKDGRQGQACLARRQAVPQLVQEYCDEEHWAEDHKRPAQGPASSASPQLPQK